MDSQLPRKLRFMPAPPMSFILRWRYAEPSTSQFLSEGPGERIGKTWEKPSNLRNLRNLALNGIQLYIHFKLSSSNQNHRQTLNRRKGDEWKGLEKAQTSKSYFWVLFQQAFAAGCWMLTTIRGRVGPNSPTNRLCSLGVESCIVHTEAKEAQLASTRCCQSFVVSTFSCKNEGRGREVKRKDKTKRSKRG